ncbi:MAG: antirestriction protein ArdA [Agathobacter sp.]|nr:antirestriction protein ArdA [Agathobacter sp.]MBP3568124.1 antirestriction protein ArdA [Lachnospiraceae bacterium]
MGIMNESGLSIWVGNQRKYTEGDLDGKWIRLPKKSEDLETILNQISNHGQDELAIMDIDLGDNCSWLSDYIDEYDDIRELNVLAKLIGENDHPAVDTYLINGGNLTISELANLLIQEEEIPFFPYEFEGSDNPEVMRNLTSEEKMGYTVIEQDKNLKGFLDTYEVGGMTNIGQYINVGNIGRDLSFSDYVDLSENGYLDKRMEFPDLNAYTIEEIEMELDEQELKLQKLEPQKVEQKEQIKQKEKTPTGPKL